MMAFHFFRLVLGVSSVPLAHAEPTSGAGDDLASDRALFATGESEDASLVPLAFDFAPAVRLTPLGGEETCTSEAASEDCRESAPYSNPRRNRARLTTASSSLASSKPDPSSELSRLFRALFALLIGGEEAEDGPASDSCSSCPIWSCPSVMYSLPTPYTPSSRLPRNVGWRASGTRTNASCTSPLTRPFISPAFNMISSTPISSAIRRRATAIVNSSRSSRPPGRAARRTTLVVACRRRWSDIFGDILSPDGFGLYS